MELVLGHREVDDMVDPTLCPRRPETRKSCRNGSERTRLLDIDISEMRSQDTRNTHVCKLSHSTHM